MKKILSSILLGLPLLVSAQGAIDAFSVSQTDLKGTARYMSMAGAYGALGGDLSAINHNPGGIGVYRSSDIGVTLNLDLQSVESTAKGVSSKVDQTKFTLNNFGYVGAFKLDSETMPFINFGFSYNRPVSYNRRYSGKISDLNHSLSNYIAGISNSNGYDTNTLAFEEDGDGNILYDPYIDSPYPQWLSVMAYNSYIINPQTYDSNGFGSNFVGLMNSNTQGFSEYEVIEEGGIDEFNMNFGGNLANMLYWGFSLGVSNLDQSRYTYYGEGLTDATVPNEDETALDNNGTASYGLENWLNTSGNGWNFKFGVIVKPINELRIGASIHTPTYWTLTDQIFSSMNYYLKDSNGLITEGYEDANAGYTYETEYKIRTPWRFNVSAATILGTKGIISFDYERVAYNDMKVEYYDYDYNTYYEDQVVKTDINNYYKAMDIYRVGAEYRVTPQLSLRLGYAYYSSPVNENAYNGKIYVNTAGTTPAYTFDKSTQYITGGLGYRYKSFYTDLAYVHKSRESEYRAFSPEVLTGKIVDSPKATLKDKNNQVVWSIGYRF